MTLAHPPAEPAPTRRTFGSVSFDDPFPWLEEDSPRALRWQAEQDAAAAAWLAALPLAPSFSQRLAAFDTGQDVLAPRFGGGRWFRQHVPEGRDLAVIDVSDEPAGAGRTVVDLNAFVHDEPAVLAWFSPSPDGRRLAFSWSDGAGAFQKLRIVDVDSGAVLVDGIPQSRASFPAWLPDGSGFWFRGDGPAGSRESGIYHFTFGDPPSIRLEPLALDHPIAWPVVSGDGRYVLAFASHLAPRPDYIRETAGGAWRPFLRDVPGTFRGVIAGDRFIAITNDGAPRGRLVSIPLETPSDKETWRELVPGSSAVLASLAIAGGRLVLVELADTYARMRVLDVDGTVAGDVALPGRGLVSTSSQTGVAIAFLECVVPGGGDDVVFVWSSLTESPALYRARTSDLSCERLSPPAARLDARVTDHAAPGADGTPIPYRVVARRDLDGTRPQPTIVLVSGGFNVALLPGWPPPALAAWVDAGGVFAIAHVRGGGEFGPEWWRAGQLRNKRNSIADLVAVAEDLVARGTTTRAQLGVYGSSNGGSLAAAAVVLRPDLFRAALPQVPVTDYFGLVRDPVTLMIAKLEDGDPDGIESSLELHAWSPYQNVVDGTPYPALLVDCSSNDPRCPAWHGRKFVARVQCATSSKRPVLLRVRQGAGREVAGRSARRLQQLELLSFFADQLGLGPTRPA